MADQPNIFGEGFRVEISADRMTATLHTTAGVAVSAAAVITALKLAGIHRFDDGEVIETLDGSAGKAITLLIARGTPTVEGHPAKLKLQVPVSTFDGGLVAKVGPGQLIAALEHGGDGQEGRDVFNTPLGGKTYGSPAGTGAVQTGKVIKSKTSGNVRRHEGLISIHPLLELGSDVPPGTTQFDGDVCVRGRLEGGRTIIAGGALIVSGTIGGASFRVGQWAYVAGAIAGLRQGSGVVGENLRCDSMADAAVSVGGDLHVQTIMENSRVSVAGRVVCERGAIVGGTLSANGGIECRVLGNFGKAATAVESGTDHTLRSILADTRAQITALSNLATGLRQQIEAFNGGRASLSPLQRQQSADTVEQARGLEARIKQLVDSLSEKARNTTERSRSEISVSAKVYPGVVIRFPGVQAVVEAPLSGPLKLYPRTTRGGLEIVAEFNDKTLAVLPSTRVADLVNPCIKRLAAVHQAA